jgi:hypothetical protein
MQSILEVPYADTGADQLCLSFDEPLLPALSTVHCAFVRVELTLRLLGASHQVRVVTADTETVETLACLPGRPRTLPTDIDAARISFRSHIERHDAASLTALAARVSDQATGPHSLIGHYPGHPNAFTAIIATDLGHRARWDTWHAYPQTGDVVVTSSVFEAVR